MAFSIWIATIAGNAALAILLVYRRHDERYKWLFLSTILATFADAVLWFCRTDDHSHYDLFRTVAHWLFLFINFAIVGEALRWRNLNVAIPIGAMVGFKFVALGLKDFGMLWTAYYMLRGLSFLNLLIIIWLLFCFRKEQHHAL